MAIPRQALKELKDAEEKAFGKSDIDVPPEPEKKMLKFYSLETGQTMLRETPFVKCIWCRDVIDIGKHSLDTSRGMACRANSDKYPCYYEPMSAYDVAIDTNLQIKIQQDESDRKRKLLALAKEHIEMDIEIAASIFEEEWVNFKLPWGLGWARPMVKIIAQYFFDKGYFLGRD